MTRPAKLYGKDYLDGRLRQLSAKAAQLRSKHLEDMERNKANHDLHWSSRIMAAIQLGKLEAYNELLEQIEKGSL